MCPIPGASAPDVLTPPAPDKGFGAAPLIARVCGPA